MTTFTATHVGIHELTLNWYCQYCEHSSIELSVGLQLELTHVFQHACQPVQNLMLPKECCYQLASLKVQLLLWCLHHQGKSTRKSVVLFFSSGYSTWHLGKGGCRADWLGRGVQHKFILGLVHPRGVKAASMPFPCMEGRSTILCWYILLPPVLEENRARFLSNDMDTMIAIFWCWDGIFHFLPDWAGCCACIRVCFPSSH